MSQVVELLLSKHQVLSSKLQLLKERNERRHQGTERPLIFMAESIV
jgi:hypothetical protein